MPYAYRAGDNYRRGDYYRGDFLGIGKFLGNVVKDVGKVAGFIPGIGTAIQAGIGIVNSVIGTHPSVPKPATLQANLMQNPSPGTRIGAVNIGGGGGNEVGLINIGGGSAALPAGRVARGYHPNKSTYETRGGGTSRWPRELEVHSPGSVLVRNRRMNVGNARALKRALRRAHGFAKLAKRVMSFTHPRAGKQAHFKFRKRK
ncbi:MAG TPA: hypothetical protein VNH14_14535 [Gemmatimonadales bacterium]|nr:hypothetical protein [Gemmatimonadales bacterium]